ncbi:MAG: pitrilysin family protein [Candidatus Eisenbacteria bacterium]
MVPPSAKGAILSHRLRNGLSVLLRPVHSAPIVSVWCWYRVGSSDEGRGATGIAHWLEHMNFKGTRRFSKEQMKNMIEKRGGYWNGYTWIDQTTYFETLPKEHLDLALELEAERMRRSRIDADEFESERTVILSELRGGENNPESVLDREVTAAAFQAHGYRWPTVGWEEDVKRISRREMVDFYRSWYVPGNAILVVVGDFDPAAALRRIRKHFGDLPGGEPPVAARTPESPSRGERRVTVEGAGRTPYLHAAYRAPAARDEDVHALVLLDAVLGGAKGINLWSYDGEVRRSSPLYRGLVDAGLAASVRSFYVPTRDPFLYYFSATAREGVTLEKLERKLLGLLAASASKRPSARDLRKAKNQLRAMVVFQSDSVTELAHQIGYYHTIHDVSFFEDFLDRIEGVTAEHVRETAEKIFHRANRIVGLYVPRRNGKRGRA